MSTVLHYVHKALTNTSTVYIPTIICNQRLHCGIFRHFRPPKHKEMNKISNMQTHEIIKQSFRQKYILVHSSKNGEPVLHNL